jgi:hypothetical protein
MIFPEDQYFISFLILGIMLKILLLTMEYQLIKLAKNIEKKAKVVPVVDLNYKSLNAA